MPSRRTRYVRVLVSVAVLGGVTVVLGYGGWLLLTVSTLVGYDPRTDDGDRLRDRLLSWPERNRSVMRTNGRESLPLRP
jgi:hypothetical protein